MKKWLLITLFIFPVAAFAQEGQVTIVQDSGVTKVVDLYQTFAKEKRSVYGFRVQIAAGTNRQAVLDQKTRFEQLYPGVNTYFTYQQPQFKLRVGDFTSRNEAITFLQQIKDNFPMSFLVPDKIMIEGVGW